MKTTTGKALIADNWLNYLTFKISNDYSHGKRKIINRVENG